MLIKKIFNKLIKFKKEIDLSENFKKKSYAQAGEDIIIEYIFRLRNINLPTYLDIGANHPFYINNTYLFYTKGSKGVNVDANPELVDLFNKHRDRDININTGVGNKDGYLDFYIISDPSLSTFSREEAQTQENCGNKIKSIVSVKIETINYIIDKYCDGIYPDLFSIDVEGLDEVIIDSMKLEKSKPKVICLETVEYTIDGRGKKKTDLINKVIDYGYTIYADTNINTIFVENKFWFYK